MINCYQPAFFIYNHVTLPHTFTQIPPPINWCTAQTRLVSFVILGILDRGIAAHIRRFHNIMHAKQQITMTKPSYCNVISLLFIVALVAPMQHRCTAIPAHHQSNKMLHWRVDHPMGPIDWTCPSLSHQMRALSCAAVEARYLNRTLVLPSAMCINPVYNQESTAYREPIQRMIDLDVLKTCIDFVLDTDPTVATMRDQEGPSNVSVREVTRFHVKPEELLEEAAQVVVRSEWHKAPSRSVERMAFPCQGRPVRFCGVCQTCMQLCGVPCICTTQEGGKGTDNALTTAAIQEGADLWTEELFSPCFVPSRHTVWVAEEIIKKIEEAHPLGHVSLHIRRGDKLKTGNFLVCV